ncbi:MAG: OsmC family protein [Gemmatimonadota bacterium]
MADSQVSLEWTGEGLRFQAAHPAHNLFRADGDGVTAHSPVQLLLLSLASCTAADVIDIARKMRVAITSLEVQIEGDRNAEPPRFFKAVRLRYIARGVATSDKPKIERAIQLSHETYCSVLHSLRKDIEFSSELVLG